MAARLIFTPAVSALHDVGQLRQAAARFQNSMSRCTMHDLDIECGTSSFRIAELLSNGTALPKSGVLAFFRVVSVDTVRCRSTSLFAVSMLLRLYDVTIQNVAT